MMTPCREPFLSDTQPAKGALACVRLDMPASTPSTEAAVSGLRWPTIVGTTSAWKAEDAPTRHPGVKYAYIYQGRWAPDDALVDALGAMPLGCPDAKAYARVPRH